MMQPRSRDVPLLRLMLGGDVMLGRVVKESMLRFGIDYPLAPIAGLLRQADLTIVNLECAITAAEHIWPGDAEGILLRRTAAGSASAGRCRNRHA